MTNLKHKWKFTSHFKAQAFGWRSDLPIKRIKEAVSEIKLISKTEPIIAANGAVLFIQKLVAALEHVDGSSGAIGTAVNNALEALSKVIAQPKVDSTQRSIWLAQLWQAMQDDGYGYLDRLDDHWDELCSTEEMASIWADELLPTVKLRVANGSKGIYFRGESICYASLYGARRYDELLTLLDQAPYEFWSSAKWGVRALEAQGKIDQAIEYAKTKSGRFVDSTFIAYQCEQILLKANRWEEAYQNYAYAANTANTNLNTLRAIIKKYPEVDPQTILKTLVSQQPGSEGKWFAAAKSLKLFELAIQLANQSPTEPQTLIRAANEFMSTQPTFAAASGMAAIRWLVLGYGYEATLSDLHEAFDLTIEAAQHAGIDTTQIATNLALLSEEPRAKTDWIKSVIIKLKAS